MAFASVVGRNDVEAIYYAKYADGHVFHDRDDVDHDLVILNVWNDPMNVIANGCEKMNDGGDECATYLPYPRKKHACNSVLKIFRYFKNIND